MNTWNFYDTIWIGRFYDRNAMYRQKSLTSQIGLGLLTLSLPTGCAISRAPSSFPFGSLATPPAGVIPSDTSILSTVTESSSAASFAQAHGIENYVYVHSSGFASHTFSKVHYMGGSLHNVATWQNHIEHKSRIVAFSSSDFEQWKQDTVQELIQRGVSKVLVDLDGNVIDPDDPSSVHTPVSPFFEDRDT